MDPVLLIVICAACIIAIWLLIRTARLNMLRCRARQRLSLPPEGTSTSARLVGWLFGENRLQISELGAYGSLTAAEFVWSWATINPQVLDAASSWSGGAIHNGFDFASFIHAHYDALGAASKEGFLNSLAGHVGEQQAADILAHAGHTVQLAANGTQPVWDLYIDGHAANVKLVSDIASFKADALAHPSVTYLVPSDAHGYATGNIVRVDGLGHDSVKDSAKDAIFAAKGEGAMHGLGVHLPWITVGFAAYRNYRLVKYSGKDPWAAAKHGVIESVGRGTGVVAGGKIGAGFGAMFGPIGMLLGAVGGALAGAAVGGALAENCKRKPLVAAYENLRQRLAELGLSFQAKLDAIEDCIRASLTSKQHAQRQLQDLVCKRKGSLGFILWPDFYTVLLEEVSHVGDLAISRENTAILPALKVVRKARSGHGWDELGLLLTNAPPVCELLGADPAMLDRIRDARAKVFTERKHLNPAFQAPS